MKTESELLFNSRYMAAQAENGEAIARFLLNPDQKNLNALQRAQERIMEALAQPASPDLK